MSGPANGDDAYMPPGAQQAPKSLLEFAEALAPIAKYYVVLLFFYYLAKRFNTAVEHEATLKERELQRPTLSTDLMDSSSEEEEEDEEEEEEKEEEEEEEEEIYEELMTDGSRLVAVPGEPEPPQLRARKATTVKKTKTTTPTTSTTTTKTASEQKLSGKSHPLFDGLKKIEEDLKREKENGLAEGETGVSWNELHKNMLKTYQKKYPDHGLRIQENDDYDDEFKEMLKKHNVNLDELKKKE